MKFLKVKEIRKLVAGKVADYNAAVRGYKTESKRLTDTLERLTDTEQARDLIQETAQEIQQRAHNQIASVVSRCLQTVFDEPYIFHIYFEAKRGRTEARLVFERNEHEVDPLTASGGGVVDVAAFALRLACLMLSRPALRRTLILDEPFKNVSSAKGYLDRIPGMLESLSQDLNVQFIIVTHIDALKMGKVVEIG